MSKFETRGCEYQYTCVTKEEAIQNFSHSCSICCNHGIRLDCDHCAINVAHNLVVAAIDTQLKKI